MPEQNDITSAADFSDRFHRRDVLLAGAAAAAGLALPSLVRSARAGAQRRPETPKPLRRAKNCIFMVSDGMSFGTLSLGRLWLKRREQQASNWEQLWAWPGVRRAAQQTHAADSLVTDSAAGGSSWGCGSHVNNGSVNVLPDGRQLLPIGPHARQGGKRFGLATTTRVCHATPASFIANAPRRDWEGMIAEQMLARGFDVALGGGEKYFPQALLAKYPGVAVARDRKSLDAAALDKPILGLFDHSHVPFVIERPETVPSLPQMARKALDVLSRENCGEGFLLQIEGGRVDHAAHGNDAPSLIREQVEFDRTLGVVMQWIKDRDDTLLVVTTDHGNANPGLTLYGKSGDDAFDRTANAKHSFDWIAEQMAPFKSVRDRAEQAPAIIHRAMGVDLDPEAVRILGASLGDNRVQPFAAANKWSSVLGSLLADHFGIAFLSPNHTADLVELTAWGPGSELVPPLVDNIQMHGVMVAALGLPEGRPLPGMDEPMTVPNMPHPD